VRFYIDYNLNTKETTKRSKMLLLGLTGSIATGKSTVSSILKTDPHNLPIIDADVLARKVVEPGSSGYKAIVDYFASTTPDLLLPADDPLCKGREDGPDGKGRPLNRPALGRRVFGSGEERVKARMVLNGIVHPAVRREMWKQVVCALLSCPKSTPKGALAHGND
jgi:dephospho-CoA kinase